MDVKSARETARNSSSEKSYVKVLRPKTTVAREWLRKHPSGTRPEFMAQTNLIIASSSFARQKQLIRAELGLPPMIRGKVDAPSLPLPLDKPKCIKVKPSKATLNPSVKTMLVERVKALEETNAYLRWRIEGERRGFITQLLTEEST